MIISHPIQKNSLNTSRLTMWSGIKAAFQGHTKIEEAKDVKPFPETEPLTNHDEKRSEDQDSFTKRDLSEAGFGIRKGQQVLPVERKELWSEEKAKKVGLLMTERDELLEAIDEENWQRDEAKLIFDEAELEYWEVYQCHGYGFLSENALAVSRRARKEANQADFRYRRRMQRLERIGLDIKSLGKKSRC